MEQQQQQGGGEARVNVASEAGQHQQQQRQHSEWVPVGRDPPGSTTLLGPFGTMAELANVGAAGGEAAVRDALAKPVPAATATAATEWLPAAPAPAPAPAAGYMEMGAMSDFEILAHDKGDESDYSPVGVRPELAMPKNWMRELEAQKEAFHGDASPPSVPRATPPGERFPPAAGLSDVDLSRPAGSPRSDDDDEGPQIESCDSSPADDMVGEFPARSGHSPGGPVAAGPPGGPPSGKTSPSDDGPPKKASSPDKPMEKLIFLAEEKYLETAAPQKRERDGPGDAETLAKNPRKDERAEAPGPRGAHAGEKPPVVYHPGYSEAETISISQESSPLEEISPISEEFTDKLIVASDEAQKRQPSTEMEYSISLSQESSPGEDASPVVGDLGRTFPKPSAAAAAAAAAQQRQPAGTDLSEEKQVPLAKKDNSLTSSYVSSSTEESSPGEERAGGEAGGRKFGDKEDFVEEVPRQARDIPAAAKTGDGGGEKPWASARRDAERAEPGLAAESLGPARGGGGDWFAEPPSSVADAGWRAVDVAADKAPVVLPSRGSGGGGGWRAEEPAGEKSSADTADDLTGFDTGSGKQQQQPQPPQQQPPAATVSFTALGAPPSSGVRVVDSSDDDDEEEEEEEEDDDEYENEFYTEDALTSPWVDKSLVPLAEEEEVAKPDKAAAAATPTAPTAPEPGPRAAVPVQPRASPAAPASGPPVPPARIAVTPAASAAEEEEAKGARPSQPSPSWPGFGPPTVIIEEAAEEGVAEREEPRGGAAARDAREESQQQQQQEEKEEEKLPVKVEEGPARPTSLLDKVHIPAVTQLVYWRDPRRSGAVLVALLLLLLSIARLSVFTIVGYLGLLVLMCTITWRVGRGVLCAVQKRDDGHPFRAYLAEDVNVTRDRMSRQVEAARVWTTGAATELRRLLLVQDLVDSLKFAGVLWLMTYVGSVFNGLSLLILGVVLLFSVPIAYEKKKTEVDHYLALVQAKVDEATARVKSVIPAALRPNEPNSTVAAK